MNKAAISEGKLIERARLTDEEIGVASEKCFDASHPEICTYGNWITGHFTRCVADAAAAKALWAMVPWLASAGAVLTSEDGTTDDASDTLADVLREAGIERPKAGMLEPAPTWR